jgi:CYTH domain-containing protein
MNIEIERRFLVRRKPWSAVKVTAPREHLVQAYLASDRERTVRIRLFGERALLTVKGPSADAARVEIECDIAAEAARAILDSHLHVGVPIEKTRTVVQMNGLTWEVDQFEGVNAGLVIAEIEYAERYGARAEWDARVDGERPEWLGREITGEPRFSKGALALRPFSAWPVEERADIVREIENDVP